MTIWSLNYDAFDPGHEKLREALCTLGNGYFCTRGAAPEAHADQVHYPGTYLAGGYNRLTTAIAGRSVENEDLVNFPNWLALSFRIEEGAWFDLQGVEILDYLQDLDLRNGLLLRSVRFRDPAGRITRLHERRLVHMRYRHLAALETTLTPEDWSGRVEFHSALDGRVANRNVARYRDLASDHLEPLASGQPDGETILLQVRTRQSHLAVAQAARTRIFFAEAKADPERRLVLEPGYVSQSFLLQLAPGVGARLEKIVALFASRDQAISEPALEARKAAVRAPDFPVLREHQAGTWKHLWQRFGLDLEISGEAEPVLRVLHLHIFHLLQTVSLHSMDLDVGVPARGWHGEAYRGHIFWDELFIFPLLNLRTPEITRTLLMYRYRRLSEARVAAQEAGLRGAMFPWQSGSNGREESQKVHLNPDSGNWIPDRSRLQRHVNAAIAWNVWQYYQVTCDTEFLSFCGAEMILEIARFWASLASWNAGLERFEILGVMGPDEYHDAYPGAERPGLDNNAYTNLMAVWTLNCAVEALKVLPAERRRELCETLELEAAEIAHWEKVSRRMRLVFHGDGILSQFEGYEKLAELDWETYRARHGDVMRLDRILEAEDDTPNRYKCSKQADVLMLFYLFSAEELGALFERLGYSFDAETIPKNVHYYQARTSHGSTLSQVVHSWVLSRLDRPASWRLLSESLHADISDIQGGTTSEGIHLGAMAGTVDLVLRGYTGIEVRGDILRFNPHLPREIDRLKMRLRYRGHTLELDNSGHRMTVKCLECDRDPITIGLGEETAAIAGGESRSWEWKKT